MLLLIHAEDAMKVVFVTNILTPYRMSFYDELNRNLSSKNDSLHVLVMTEELPLRPWKYEEYKREYTFLLPGLKFYYRQHDIVINKKVKRVLKSLSPDVVVLAGSWTYPTIYTIAYLRKFYLNPNSKLFFWYESHDNASDDFVAQSTVNGLISSIKTIFMRRFDGFCVPGELAKESVLKFVDNTKRYIHLRNAVDGQFYQEAMNLRSQKDALREKYELKKEATLFIIPARLIRLKGIDGLLDRIDKEIIRAYPFQFVLAGEGDQKERIAQIATRKGISVAFLGYQKQENVRELLACCDFFCLPSLTDANPLSAIEAAWAGLPLLLSKYTGNYPELVRNGENGFVFDPLDEVSINTMMRKVLSSTDEWRKNAEGTSNAIAKCDFDVSQIASEFCEGAFKE